VPKIRRFNKIMPTGDASEAEDGTQIAYVNKKLPFCEKTSIFAWA
jgi:hypothetical protein